MSQVLLAVIAGVVALFTAGLLFLRVQRNPVENDVVNDIGDLIKEGAMAFLRREYTICLLYTSDAADE